MNENFRPFNSTKLDGEHYCPKCNYKINIMSRTICKGKFVIWGPKCPKVEHFHHKCVHCGGTWCEAPAERHKEEVKALLESMLEMCSQEGMTEEDIINAYRTKIIGDVMSE